MAYYLNNGKIQNIDLETAPSNISPASYGTQVNPYQLQTPWGVQNLFQATDDSGSTYNANGTLQQGLQSNVPGDTANTPGLPWYLRQQGGAPWNIAQGKA